MTNEVKKKIILALEQGKRNEGYVSLHHQSPPEVLHGCQLASDYGLLIKIDTGQYRVTAQGYEWLDQEGEKAQS